MDDLFHEHDVTNPTSSLGCGFSKKPFFCDAMIAYTHHQARQTAHDRQWDAARANAPKAYHKRALLPIRFQKFREKSSLLQRSLVAVELQNQHLSLSLFVEVFLFPGLCNNPTQALPSVENKVSALTSCRRLHRSAGSSTKRFRR